MTPVIKFPGCVVAIGSAAEPAAALYAELTGRTYHLCISPDQLVATGNDVVVCLFMELTATLMHRLYSGHSQGIPGLICGKTAVDLENICIRQAQHVSSYHTQAQRLFLYPKGDFGIVENGCDVFLGGAQPSESAATLLRENPALFVLVDRADGFPHIQLSRRKYACPFLIGPAPQGELLPICQAEGRCSRLPGMPKIQDAQANGNLKPLSILRGGVALLHTCSVVQLQNHVVDPAYALAPALLRQASFGAIVTTWRDEDDAADGSHLNSLINDLCAGTKVGAAVWAFNGSPIAQHLGIRLCILGDPCFALQANELFLKLPEGVIRPEPQYKPEKPYSMRAEANMLRDAIRGAIRVSGSYDMERAENLLCRLADSDIGRDWAEADTMLLDFLSGLPWLNRFLGRVGERSTVSEDGYCPNCSAPSRIEWVRFPRYAAVSRRIVRCPCCGDSSFQPKGWNLKLDFHKIDERVLGLSGAPEGAQARLYISTTQQMFRSCEWPISHGGPAQIALPADLPEAPLSCLIVAAHQLQLGAVSLPLRQLRSGGLSSPAADQLNVGKEHGLDWSQAS